MPVINYFLKYYKDCHKSFVHTYRDKLTVSIDGYKRAECNNIRTQVQPACESLIIDEISHISLDSSYKESGNNTNTK